MKGRMERKPTMSEKNEPFGLAWTDGGEPPKRRIDFGPHGVGGRPVVEVAKTSGPCVLHLFHGCAATPLPHPRLSPLEPSTP